jgi:hypothetical protein
LFLHLPMLFEELVELIDAQSAFAGEMTDGAAEGDSASRGTSLPTSIFQRH